MKDDIAESLIKTREKLLPLIKDRKALVEVSLTFGELIKFVRRLSEGKNAANK